MDTCKLGFHKWAYADDNKSRWCERCKQKQKKDSAGTWIENRPVENMSQEEGKFCECPGDYTIAIKTMSCPRCKLPKRPRVIPTGNRVSR